jgi:hypothetical protein
MGQLRYGRLTTAAESGRSISRFLRRFTPLPFSGVPIVARYTALYHFVAPFVACHDEGSEVATTKAKRAERYHNEYLQEQLIHSPLTSEPALGGAVADNSGESISMIKPAFVRPFVTNLPCSQQNRCRNCQFNNACSTSHPLFACFSWFARIGLNKLSPSGSHNGSEIMSAPTLSGLGMGDSVGAAPS